MTWICSHSPPALPCLLSPPGRWECYRYSTALHRSTCPRSTLPFSRTSTTLLARTCSPSSSLNLPRPRFKLQSPSSLTGASRSAFLHQSPTTPSPVPSRPAWPTVSTVSSTLTYVFYTCSRPHKDDVLAPTAVWPVLSPQPCIKLSIINCEINRTLLFQVLIYHISSFLFTASFTTAPHTHHIHTPQHHYNG